MYLELEPVCTGKRHLHTFSPTGKQTSSLFFVLLIALSYTSSSPLITDIVFFLSTVGELQVTHRQCFLIGAVESQNVFPSNPSQSLRASDELSRV